MKFLMTATITLGLSLSSQAVVKSICTKSSHNYVLENCLGKPHLIKEEARKIKRASFKKKGPSDLKLKWQQNRDHYDRV